MTGTFDCLVHDVYLVCTVTNADLGEGLDHEEVIFVILLLTPLHILCVPAAI